MTTKRNLLVLIGEKIEFLIKGCYNFDYESIFMNEKPHCFKIKGEIIMIDVNNLSKDELIANLWLTDEMINEIEIVKREIDKKKATLEATISSTKQEHLEMVKKKYYDSEEYKAHQSYQNLTEKLAAFKGVAILLDLIICVLLGYGLIILSVPFLHVVLFWIITPVIVYLLYQQVVKYYLVKQKPTEIPSLETVLEEAKNSIEYEKISNSLIANHIRDEMTKLGKQQSELEILLAQKTVLPELYRMRAREVVWYLENLMADNLKEALAALVEADHRQQMKEMMNEQNQEISQLKEITAKLMEQNQKLAQKVEEQRQQLVELENKKK